LNRTIYFVLILTMLSGCAKEESVTWTLDESSLRHLSSGNVIGVTGEYEGNAWLGLPYAKAPINALRWRAPQAVESWQEDRIADHYGNVCTQFAGSAGGEPGERGTVVGSEDCLFLSVYAPVLSGTEKLPVMVWLHGGSNRHGAGSFYDGSRLASEQKVIVVSINYRLGPFGWFKHPSLNSDGDLLDKSGNYGTLDILSSLAWVQDNIGEFGGDKSNVTLFGESAGAFDILSLMLSPLSEGLFHKAISQSGGISINPISSAMNYADDDGHEFSSQQVDLYLRVQDGSAENLVNARTQVEAQDDKMRSNYLLDKSAEEVMMAYGFGKDQPAGRSVNVIADGHVLPKVDPVEAFSDKNAHMNIPLLIGTNRDEMKLYLFGNPDFVDTYFSFYPVIKDEDFYEASADYYTRMWKYNGVDRIAAAILSSGQKSPVWAYRFDWDEQATPLGIALNKLLGAGHGMEIPFVFGFTSKSEIWTRMYDETNKASREKLSFTMRNYWAAFAYSGNPNHGLDDQKQVNQDKNWLPWGADSRAQYMVFDSDQGGGLKMSSNIVTMAKIASDIETDSRLASTKQKCEIFSGLTQGENKDWPVSAYAEKLAGRCADYPL